MEPLPGQLASARPLAPISRPPLGEQCVGRRRCSASRCSSSRLRVAKSSTAWPPARDSVGPSDAPEAPERLPRQRWRARRTVLTISSGIWFGGDGNARAMSASVPHGFSSSVSSTLALISALPTLSAACRAPPLLLLNAPESRPVSRMARLAASRSGFSNWSRGRPRVVAPPRLVPPVPSPAAHETLALRATRTTPPTSSSTRSRRRRR